ncbi:hypothetical protein H4W33_002858 [Kibdelosporangium phytohabitans]|nr:hypothetical protein [Kibdelosporangium phytohabitans]
MNTVPSFELQRVASECVELVDAQFQRQLDWSVDSL